jgi:hypothetical protein
MLITRRRPCIIIYFILVLFLSKATVPQHTCEGVVGERRYSSSFTTSTRAIYHMCRALMSLANVGLVASLERVSYV